MAQDGLDGNGGDNGDKEPLFDEEYEMYESIGK